MQYIFIINVLAIMIYRIIFKESLLKDLKQLLELICTKYVDYNTKKGYKKHYNKKSIHLYNISVYYFSSIII